MASPPSVKFIYKIYLPEDQSLEQVSGLDKASGYIHLSTAQQVPVTANRFFADQTELWLHKVDFESVAPKIKWEDSDGSLFPHLYDQELDHAIERNAGNSIKLLKWKRGGKSWVEAAIGWDDLE
jgi:uncharacterized protein (DUF952 family)